MKLATLEAVRTHLGLDDMTNVNGAISSGLDAATSHLASNLRTRFERTSHTDIFFINSMDIVGLRGFTTLLLKQGFVDVGVTPTYVSSERFDFETTEDISEFSFLDAVRGVISVRGKDLTNRYVQVTYTSGFNSDTNDPDFFAPAEVPDWLTQAAILTSILTLEGNVLVQDEDEDSKAVKLANTKMAVTGIIEPFIRYEPLAKSPLS